MEGPHQFHFVPPKDGEVYVRSPYYLVTLLHIILPGPSC